MEAVWKDLVESRAGLPAGMAVFLKVATISEPERGKVILDIPAMGLERLTSEPTARVQIAKTLSEKLGREVTLELKGAATTSEKTKRPEAPRRLTPELVKTEKLARMAKEDPILGQAVEEWNLELLD